MENLLNAFVIIASTIFVAELTDKDALLILALATRTRPGLVFVAGSTAFAITTAIIVLVGAALVTYVPIFWVKVSGGAIMLAYAVWEYREGLVGEESVGKSEQKLLMTTAVSVPLALLRMISSLVILDLAGDATEILTIVFVAHYNNALLVFSAALAALVTATALETVIGNRLGRILSSQRIRYLSVVVFSVIGTVVILSAVLPLP